MEYLQNLLKSEWFGRIIIFLVGSLTTYLTMRWFRNSVKNALVENDKNNQQTLKDYFGQNTILVDSTKPNLWSGFNGDDFKSYNDPWIMEMKSNTNDFINVHRERYLSLDCATFNFLFFTKDNRWGPFKRFVKFQAMVHLKLEPTDIDDDVFAEKMSEKIAKYKNDNNEEEWQNTIKHINVFFNKEFERPFITFFRGYKNDRKLALLYISLKDQEERPHMTIQITDTESWKELEKTWNNASEDVDKLNGIEIFDMYLKIKDL